MQLVNEFTVPTSVDEAWSVLSDLERVVTCLPGAAIDGRDGDTYRGHVDVKVGPVGLSFSGLATVVECDAVNRRLVIRGVANDARGQGEAQADIALTVEGSGSEAQVSVVTDLALSGKVAQFGSGMVKQVNRRIIGQFTRRLDQLIRSGEGEATPRTSLTPPLTAGQRSLPAFPAEAVGTAVAGAMFGLALARAVRFAARG